MRALTLIQPWATAIMLCGKDVENRGRGPWSTLKPGERIAIHAGKSFDFEAVLRLCLHGMWPDDVPSEPCEGMPQVALLGTVEIAAVVHDPREREPRIRGCVEAGRLALGSRWRVLDATTLICVRDPRPLPEPIPCKGALGLWNVPAEHVAALEGLVDNG